jgi:hypothetical protein
MQRAGGRNSSAPIPTVVIVFCNSSFAIMHRSLSSRARYWSRYPAKMRPDAKSPIDRIGRFIFDGPDQAS